jgi:hypothetical protein
MMPTMDGDDNASLGSMFPKTRLSRRNADFQASWLSPHKANDRILKLRKSEGVCAPTVSQ